MDVAHLRDLARLAEGVTWTLVVEGVSTLVARGWVAWPGEPPDLGGLTRTEEQRFVAEYQEKGRTISVDWNDFEASVRAHGLWLKDGVLRESVSTVILLGNGHDNVSGRYFEFEVSGRALRCQRSDGVVLSVEELLDLGERYWKGFGAPR